MKMNADRKYVLYATHRFSVGSAKVPSGGILDAPEAASPSQTKPIAASERKAASHDFGSCV
jgi:hypothetical protein